MGHDVVRGGEQSIWGSRMTKHELFDELFDLSGRVFKGVPAPTNLRIPPYSFLDDRTLIIGVNPHGAV